jgi:hypothetical protein
MCTYLDISSISRPVLSVKICLNFWTLQDRLFKKNSLDRYRHVYEHHGVIMDLLFINKIFFSKSWQCCWKTAIMPMKPWKFHKSRRLTIDYRVIWFLHALALKASWCRVKRETVVLCRLESYQPRVYAVDHHLQTQLDESADS